jgi:hypothetical protein
MMQLLSAQVNFKYWREESQGEFILHIIPDILFFSILILFNYMKKQVW